MQSVWMACVNYTLCSAWELVTFKLKKVAKFKKWYQKSMHLHTFKRHTILKMKQLSFRSSVFLKLRKGSKILQKDSWTFSLHIFSVFNKASYFFNHTTNFDRVSPLKWYQIWQKWSIHFKTEALTINNCTYRVWYNLIQLGCLNPWWSFKGNAKGNVGNKSTLCKKKVLQGKEVVGLWLQGLDDCFIASEEFCYYSIHNSSMGQVWRLKFWQPYQCLHLPHCK